MNLEEEEEPLCSCKELYLSYGRQSVLRGCELEVHSGRVVGIMGENGNGKSTLVKCLLGLLRPASGSVRCTSEVGYCPQEDYLHRNYRVSEHLDLVRSFGDGKTHVDEQYLEHCVSVLKLTAYLDYPIGRLSGGTYQKVKLLTAIMRRPRLMVLDEPTDGFDWSMYLVFWDLMQDLVERGSGLLVISHLLHDIERFDEVHDLREGALHAYSRAS